MKKLFTFAFALLLVQGVFAQGYVQGLTTGTSEPYDYNGGSNGVLSITSQDVLSSTQTLPFSFSFYGQPVTSYKVSDNGYITFDANATTSDPNNTTIPNAGGPNNAIYAFWDDLGVLSGSGSPDAVNTWTYGTTPNRVHVIQWFSVTPTNGSGFVYAAIRLYECGDFDVILNFGNGSPTSATIGCENAAGTDATMVTGSPNIAYPTLQGANTDDMVYTFYDNGINYDLSINSINLDKYVTVGANTVYGTITNLGSQTVTSFDLHYSIDGGTAVTDNISSVSIIPLGGTYNFTHSTPWNVTAGGQNHAVRVWADNINGANADERSCNDEVNTNVFSNLGLTGTKSVLIEEFSGAWCGWCPDGQVVLEQILASNAEAVGVTVHDGDAMEFNDGIRTAFNVTAYPNGQVDRYQFSGESKVPHSRGAWVSNAATRMNENTPADVTVGSVYNAGTREVTATVEAHFRDFAAGDLRLVLMVVEDSVVGSGTGYNQVNYLNTQAGHPWQGAGDPIVGYVHDHTLRMLPDGAMGANINDNGNTICAPGDYKYIDRTFTLPASYDPAQVKLVGFLYQYESDVLRGEVYDVDEEPLGIALSRTAPVNETVIEGVYPNPAVQIANVKVSFAQNTNADVAVYNTFGQQVKAVNSGKYASGTHTIWFSVEDLAAGVYYVTVATDKGSMTEKLVVTK